MNKVEKLYIIKDVFNKIFLGKFNVKIISTKL